jgi:hypothetical protein
MKKLLVCLILIMVSCDKDDTNFEQPGPDPGNDFETNHKPLLYLIDYIKENGKTIISWKFNARYEAVKSVHIKSPSGEEIAEVSYPNDFYELTSSYSDNEIVLQLENTQGKMHIENVLNLDRDQEYQQLQENQPMQSVAINSTGTPYFHKIGETTPLNLYGANYVRLRGQTSRLQGDHSTFEAATPSTGADYNPYHAETLFRSLKSKGFNYVRVFLIGRSMVNPGISGSISLNEPVYGPYMDNFIDFLKRARKYGIYVYPTIGDGELPNNAYYRSRIPTNRDLGYLRLYFPFVKEAVDAKAEYLQAIVSYIKSFDATLINTLFAIELQNEYALHADVWPFTQGSGSFESYWGETYDMADTASRQKLADDATIRYQNQMVEALDLVAPDLLVGEGFFTMGAVGKNPEIALGLYPGNFADERYPPSFDVTSQSNIDFIDIHTYPESAGISMQSHFDQRMSTMLEGTTSLNEILAKKPIILGEFGAFYENEKGNDITTTANRMADLAQVTMNSGFGGWCYWTFDTFEQKRIFNMVEENQEIMNAISPIQN